MSDTTLHCLGSRCHWSGTVDELVATEHDQDTFTYCPNCEGDAFEEEDGEEFEEEDES